MLPARQALRIHSQEMALRAMELGVRLAIWEKPPSNPEQFSASLQSLADWFDSDVDQAAKTGGDYPANPPDSPGQRMEPAAPGQDLATSQDRVDIYNLAMGKGFKPRELASCVASAIGDIDGDGPPSYGATDEEANAYTKEHLERLPKEAVAKVKTEIEEYASTPF